MTTAVDDAKRALRAEARAVRDAAHDLNAASQALTRAETILPADGVVAGYLGIGSELDPRPLLERLASRRTVSLPVASKDAPLAFRRWAPGDPLATGGFKVPEPVGGEVVAPDVLLVPLLAFDRSGGRLGYGGGHYDRTLADLRATKPVFALGLAFAAQEVAACPRGRYDEPLNALVTERETLFFDRPAT